MKEKVSGKNMKILKIRKHKSQIAITLLTLSLAPWSFAEQMLCRQVLEVTGQTQSASVGKVKNQNTQGQIVGESQSNQVKEFSVSRPTLSAYIAAGTKKPEGFIEGSITDFRKAVAAQSTWKGTSGLKGLSPLLPEGASFISHQLSGAMEPGVVKSKSGGNLVHLRVELNGWATNVGINSKALLDNATRSNKSFVSEDAEVVIIFLHGFGTKGTGHHVPANLLNYFAGRKVSLISMDLDGHGEGDRSSPEYLDRMTHRTHELVKKFVSASNKKYVVMGHSGGGNVAERYNRLYSSDPNLLATVPLSPVADFKPGASFAEKRQAEKKHDKSNETDPRIPDWERNLGRNLLVDGKVSLVAGAHADIHLLGVDFTHPVDGGKNLKPSSVIIGQGDALYSPELFEPLNRLAHSRVTVLGPHREFGRSSLENVGHIFFDFLPNIEILDPQLSAADRDILLGKGDYKQKQVDRVKLLVAEGKIRIEEGVGAEDIRSPIVFTLVKNFIGEQLYLSKVKEGGAADDKALLSLKTLPQVTKEDTATITLVMQAYANNLAFRKFAEHYEVLVSEATPLARDKVIYEKHQVDGEWIKQTAREVSKNSASPEKIKKYQEVMSDLGALRKIQADKGIVATENREEFDKLTIEKTTLSAVIDFKIKRRSEIRQQSMPLLSKIKRQDALVQSYKQIFSNPELVKTGAREARTFALLMARDQQIRDHMAEFFQKELNQGRFAPRLLERMAEDPNFDKKVRSFERLTKKLNELQSATQAMTLREAQNPKAQIQGQESMTPEVLQALRDAMQATAEALFYLKREYAALENESNTLAEQVSRESSRLYAIELRRAELAASPYYSTQRWTIAKVVNSSSPAQLADVRSPQSRILQELWSHWATLANAQIVPEVSDSLY